MPFYQRTQQPGQTARWAATTGGKTMYPATISFASVVTPTKRDGAPCLCDDLASSAEALNFSSAPRPEICFLQFFYFIFLPVGPLRVLIFHPV